MKKPFKINIRQSILDDLKIRIENTRWTDEIENSKWEHGKPEAKATKKIEVPTAVTMFPKDLVNAPRDFADKFFNVQQWTEMPKGGHLAAMEQPELLAEDIKKFVTALQAHPQSEGISISI